MIIRIVAATWVKIKWTPGNKNSGAISGHEGVTCSRLGSVGAFCRTYMAGKVSSVSLANHIQETIIFFKEIAVVILVQVKTMLSLQKVCESCIE